MDKKSYTQEVIEEWSVQRNNQDHIKSFLELPVHHTEDAKKLREDIHQEVFEQFDCLACANCCKTTPPIYTNKDVKRIAGHLGIPPKTFKRKYTLQDVDGTLVGIRVPCQFLNDDHTCSIYAVRPEACRRYPHTDEEAFAERPDLNYMNTIVCPAAFKIVDRLLLKL